MSHKLKGISASNGVAIAKSYILSEPSFDITDSKIENVNSEIEKFNKAVKLTEQQLQNIYEITKTKLDESKAEIFLAHIQLAQDPEINNDIIHEITENKNNVVFSVETIFNKY
jgi:phosphotransferase system enzyme I (PtsI)